MAEHLDPGVLADLALADPDTADGPTPWERAHLDACAACRHRLASLRQVVTSARAATLEDLPVAPPPRVWEALSRAIARESATPPDPTADAGPPPVPGAPGTATTPDRAPGARPGGDTPDTAAGPGPAPYPAFGPDPGPRPAGHRPDREPGQVPDPYGAPGRGPVSGTGAPGAPGPAPGAHPDMSLDGSGPPPPPPPSPASAPDAEPGPARLPDGDGVAGRTGPQPARRPAWLRRPALALAAASLVAGGAVGGATAWWVLDEGGGGTVAATGEAHRLAPLVAGPASGTARMEEGPGADRRMRISVEGLPPTEGYYEVWLMDLTHRRLIAIGVLGPDGTAVLPLPDGVDLAAYPLVDVSAQAYDGDPAHSGRSVVRGPVTG